MENSKAFQKTIQRYLDERAERDQLFAAQYAKPNKDIRGCMDYIVNAVYDSGCNGFTDEEVYSMAVHYYDEDDLVVGEHCDCSVVVNHTVELTEEEKENAKTVALAKLEEESYQALKKKSVRAVKESSKQQLNLFDL